MNSAEFWTHILAIKEEGSTLQKENMLIALRDADPVFSARAMKAAFDDRITYGVAKKIPERTFGGDEVFDDSTWDLLDDLAARNLTGNNAQKAIKGELDRLDVRSAQLLISILQKNFRAGFGVDVVNEVWGNIVPVFEVMLAKNYADKPPKTWPVWVDDKYDGVRGIAFSDSRGFFSRSGKALEAPADLLDAVESLFEDLSTYCGEPVNAVLDCELVALAGTFKATMSQVRATKRGAAPGTVGIRIIDLITREEFDAGVSDSPQKDRREWLEEFLLAREDNPLIGISDGELAEDDEAVQRIYAARRLAGLEGVIVKPLDGLWEKKRSSNWLKIKPKGTTEGRICGYEPGARFSKYEGTIGAVRARLENGVIVSAAGMTDEMRDYINKHQDELMGQIVDLTFHEVTEDGSLRHPRIDIIRDDKDEVNP